MFYFDRSVTTSIDTTARYALGQIAWDLSTGEAFRYVQNGGADTTVATKLAGWLTAGTRGVCTMTEATVTDGTLGTVTKPAGVWQAAIPTTKYGWLCVVSDYTDVYTDGGVVDGDALVCDGGATQTFIADTAVAGEEHAVFGHARAADVSTNVKAAINCL